MINRLLHKILTTGVASIAADLTLLDDLFTENYGLTNTEVTAIKTYFEANGLNVINGYARRDTEFPVVAIVLGEEHESEHFIGDDGGQIDDEADPFYPADIETAIWEHNYPLMIYTEHPDLTAYYYEIVKYILLAGINALVDDGAFEFHMSGNDLAPDPQYLPEHLYGRQLRFVCQREFQRVARASRLDKAVKVGGIHIDKSGSPGDVGEVKTKVVPYVVDEDEEEDE